MQALTNLKSSIVSLIALLACISFATHSQAEIAGARVSPSSMSVIQNQALEFTATWQIATDENASEVVSPAGVIVNPKNGSELGRFGEALNLRGPRPFVHQETISIPANLSESWFAAGLSTVLLKRDFSEANGRQVISSRISLRLSESRLGLVRGSHTGKLAVQSLQIEFANGNDLAFAKLDETLRAKLIISHTGTGVMEGRWQLAEPIGNGEAPIFRTLALVTKSIQANQSFTLESPALPTRRPGRFLLRFCLNNSQGNSSALICDDASSARSAYQVQGKPEVSIKRIQINAPSDNNVGLGTPLTWQAIPDTAIYQLQIFALTLNEATLPSSRDERRQQTTLLKPTFLIGMMLPAKQTTTTLSDLVAKKLTRGNTYLWRVSGIDSAGRTIGMSEDLAFTYQGSEHN